MTELLPGMHGEARSRELSQFYTPERLAMRVSQWAVKLETPSFVLEPAAGRGALIKALDHVFDGQIVAWDIDPENCEALRALAQELEAASLRVCEGDFLTCKSVTSYDSLALLNPPYEGNQDVRFVERSLDCCDRAVGIFQSRILHSKGRAEFWRWTDISRMAVLSERPHFGGEHSAKTDFLVLELRRRQFSRKQGEATPGHVEWW